MLGNLLFDFEPGNDRRYWLALISSVVQILGMAALLLAGWLPIPELPRVQALQTLLASPPVSGRLENQGCPRDIHENLQCGGISHEGSASCHES
jgi:hypothetical protein